MRYLLDTHVFLWLDADPGRLSKRIVTIFEDQSNSFLLSVASLWEIQIKFQLGKLKLNSPLADIVAAYQTQSRLRLLLITPTHVLALANLPDFHRDPFDRMLIAQTIAENLVLITDDTTIAKYPIQHVW